MRMRNLLKTKLNSNPEDKKKYSTGTKIESLLDGQEVDSNDEQNEWGHRKKNSDKLNSNPENKQKYSTGTKTESLLAGQDVDSDDKQIK